MCIYIYSNILILVLRTDIENKPYTMKDEYNNYIYKIRLLYYTNI
jgi:hypothetical protein